MTPDEIMKQFRRGLKTSCFLPLMLLASPAFYSYASAAEADVGTNTGQFLKIATGARGAAMGEAYSAMADDAFALDWNPAGISNIKYRSLVFMHSEYIADTSLDYLSYAENTGDMGAWSVAAKYMNYGKVKGIDESGFDTSDFTPYDLSLSIGFSCYITGFNRTPDERFVMGATGKLVNSSIKNSDNTLSADLGLLTPWMFGRHFRMALVSQNIIGSLRYDAEDYDLPLVIRFGTLIRISDHISLTGDLIRPSDYRTYFAAGTEIKLSPAESTDVYLRGGLNNRAEDEDVNGSKNVSFGAGIRRGIYSVDYSFAPFGELGNAQRISLSINFNKPETVKKRRRGT